MALWRRRDANRTKQLIFVDKVVFHEAHVDFHPTNNAYLLIDEPIEPKMSFVTEDDFAMKLIILAHLFQSPIGERTSLQMVQTKILTQNSP